jgi:hypothetical protein
MHTLYKFIADPEVVQFLLRGVAKLTPIPELNDPSELIPNVIMDEVKVSLARLRQQGYSEEDMLHLQRQGSLLQRLAPQFQAIDVPRTKERATAIIRSSFYDDIPRLEQLLNDTAREMSSKVGLFCLSRRYDSLPMWAHYTGNAAGLAVELRKLDEVFRGDETGVLYQPIPIRYERESLGVTFDPQSHKSLFFAKFQDWSYEQEVRVVLPLADCRQELVGGKILYLHDLPRNCITRVVLGWNMLPEKVEAVRAYVRAINGEVEVVQARCVRGRVELDRCGRDKLQDE